MLVTVLGAGLASSFTRTATLSELSGTIACSPVPCIVPLGGGGSGLLCRTSQEKVQSRWRGEPRLLSLFFLTDVTVTDSIT